jgi:hypothetical protein
MPHSRQSQPRSTRTLSGPWISYLSSKCWTHSLVILGAKRTKIPIGDRAHSNGAALPFAASRIAYTGVANATQSFKGAQSQPYIIWQASGVIFSCVPRPVTCLIYLGSRHPSCPTKQTSILEFKGVASELLSTEEQPEYRAD